MPDKLIRALISENAASEHITCAASVQRVVPGSHRHKRPLQQPLDRSGNCRPRPAGRPLWDRRGHRPGLGSGSVPTAGADDRAHHAAPMRQSLHRAAQSVPGHLDPGTLWRATAPTACSAVRRRTGRGRSRPGLNRPRVGIRADEGSCAHGGRTHRAVTGTRPGPAAGPANGRPVREFRHLDVPRGWRPVARGRWGHQTICSKLHGKSPVRVTAG
jgi:hypothetical protein